MGRRSDHTRDELRGLILDDGSRLMAEVGLARFSAREVAKRIGYTIGTIHNVFGGNDRLIAAINTRSFGLWVDDLEVRLAESEDDRIGALVAGYFAFAREHPRLWMAIFDHRLPDGIALSDDDVTARGALTAIVVDEVAGVLGRDGGDDVGTLARSLVATVHGHCAFAISGAWDMMVEDEPEAVALARVREALRAHARTAA